MSTEASADIRDPLSVVGESMSAAIKSGTSDAKDAVSRAIPATTKAVSKAVYSTFYYVSYGVVYTSLFVGSFIPLENPIGFGLVDGAAAAQDAVVRYTSKRSDLVSTVTEGLGIEPTP